MKNTLIICFILFSAIAFAGDPDCLNDEVRSVIAENSFLDDGRLMPKPIRVRIAFDIAAPRYGCDMGVGICKVSLGAGRIGGDGRNAGGECYFEDGFFFVSIFRDYISPELEKELSQARFFVIQENTEVPEIWLNKMEIQRSYVIPPGNYEMAQEADFFLVKFIVK